MAARNGYSSENVHPPRRQRLRISRGGFAAILCLLIPPIGILLLWRMGMFKIRGRVLITALSTLLMSGVILLLLPGSTLQTESPLPGVPSRATPAPEGEVKTALSNIEELLYQKQLEEVIDSGGSEADLLSDQEALAREKAEQEAILNTIVYAYNGSGARYYHANVVCGNQSNGRKLTVAQAMEEHLGPCPDCNPPVYGLASSTNTSEDSDSSGN